jgi:hypothetical protein
MLIFSFWRFNKTDIMPSNPDSTFQFRDVTLAKFYDNEFGRQQRWLTAKRDLERYRYMLSTSIPPLTPDEAVKLWACFNGSNTSHTEMLPTLQQAVIAELLEQNEIELAHKIKDWSLCQWLAVIDACDRVGAGSYRIENLARELRRVGLANQQEEFS